MRVWIASEEDEKVLLGAQIGFPHLFTDKHEEGKTGPFPLSYLRDLIIKARNEDEVDFPVPYISLCIEDIPPEVMNQIRSLARDKKGKIPCKTYFPHVLHEISHRGTSFYLGYIEITHLTLVVKSAVYIDT